MKTLIQHVNHAKVEVDNQITGQINQGLLVFISIQKSNEKPEIDKIIKRLLSYRIFSDSDGKMNLSVNDIAGGVLLVSQFTLATDTQSGTRHGFSTANPPTEAEALYDYMVKKCKQHIQKWLLVFLLLICKYHSQTMVPSLSYSNVRVY